MNLILSNLNPDQQQAVLHESGPAMVLAGAGSGKTTVLTSRAAWLIQEKNVDPSELLIVTFTNKAAGEIKERIKKLTGFLLPLSGTFHSICAKILREDGEYAGLSSSFTIYDSDDQLTAIKQIYKKHGFSKKDFNPKAIKASISKNKNELISWQEYQQSAIGQYQEQVAKIYKLYQHLLQNNEAVDFDDLLVHTIKLLQKHPQIQKKYQSQLQYVLVDEYQDTNKAQYELTKLFAYPQNNLYVVGDFSQSIYAWRGADYRNMLAIHTDFKNVTEYKLEQNYRSTQTILDAATHVISHITSHPILDLWTKKKNQETITLHAAKDKKHEAEIVTSLIRQYQSDYELNRMVILYRTNAQSREFEEAFVRHRIPYKVVGGLKFYERKEVKDVLAYLKVLANSNDTISYNRIEKIGKRRLQSFESWKRTILNNYQLSELEPGKIIPEILEASTYLKKYDQNDPEDATRLDNIQELLKVASQFSDITQFLENVALIQNDQLPDSPTIDPNNVITMMSLHAAKGLEFDLVYMVGMEEGVLPHSRSFMDKKQMDEERRLCYVGITRAKEKLFFTYSQRGFSYQNYAYTTKSRFLHDIPQHLITAKGEHSLYNNQTDTWSTLHSKKRKSIPKKTRKYVPVDDENLDAILNDEIDIETFLNS